MDYRIFNCAYVVILMYAYVYTRGLGTPTAIEKERQTDSQTDRQTDRQTE